MFQLMRLQFVIVLLFCCISLMGQTIRGLVVNSNKEGIPYANVVLVAKKGNLRCLLQGKTYCWIIA